MNTISDLKFCGEWFFIQQTYLHFVWVFVTNYRVVLILNAARTKPRFIRIMSYQKYAFTYCSLKIKEGVFLPLRQKTKWKKIAMHRSFCAVLRCDCCFRFKAVRACGIKSLQFSCDHFWEMLSFGIAVRKLYELPLRINLESVGMKCAAVTWFRMNV